MELAITSGMSMTVHDCYRMGFGEPVAVSASTGEGMVDLYDALRPFIDAAQANRAGRGHFIPPVASFKASTSDFDAETTTAENNSSSQWIGPLLEDRTLLNPSLDGVSLDKENEEEEDGEGASDMAVAELGTQHVIRMAILGQPNVVSVHVHRGQ